MHRQENFASKSNSKKCFPNFWSYSSPLTLLASLSTLMILQDTTSHLLEQLPQLNSTSALNLVAVPLVAWMLFPMGNPQAGSKVVDLATFMYAKIHSCLNIEPLLIHVLNTRLQSINWLLVQTQAVSLFYAIIFLWQYLTNCSGCWWSRRRLWDLLPTNPSIIIWNSALVSGSDIHDC
jgi:hypothetical protein